MSDLMYDAVTVEHIPLTATHVAAYVDGYRNLEAMRKRFPKALLTTITVKGSVADVLDVERGAATITDARRWVLAMRKIGRRPIVYCSKSNLPRVQTAMRDAKVADPFYWVADWTDVPHLVTGSIATQFKSVPHDYDVSLLRDDFPKPLQRKVTPVKINITAAQAKSALIQLAALAGVVNTYVNEGHLPVAVRTAVGTISGLIIVVEHYFVKTSIATAAAAPEG
jgi:hypothetical protein